MYCIIFLLFPTIISSKISKDSRDICNSLNCDNTHDTACGLRVEEGGFRFKLFQNECELLKYGCDSDGEDAYGLINKEFCESEDQDHRLGELLLEGDCGCDGNITEPVCAMKKVGDGFIARWFNDRCELINHNCKNTVRYVETDDYVCNYNTNDTSKPDNETSNVNEHIQNITNLIVVNTKMDENINDTIDKFFATTHIYDVPLQEVRLRRKWVKNAGPINVFSPLKFITNNMSDDPEYKPLIRTCMHKCPTKCPSAYTPVCGVMANYEVRYPGLMFQNHCLLDMASCQIYWEKDSRGSYVESPIFFCLGDELDESYKFLPALRTLQKMGRLKKKGEFRYKIKNFKYLNKLGEVRPMG